MMAFTVAAVPVSAATAAPAFAATAAPPAMERVGRATPTDRPRAPTTAAAIKMRAGRAATTACTNTAASGAPATGILGEACGGRRHRQNQGYYGSGNSTP